MSTDTPSHIGTQWLWTKSPADWLTRTASRLSTRWVWAKGCIYFRGIYGPCCAPATHTSTSQDTRPSGRSSRQTSCHQDLFHDAYNRKPISLKIQKHDPHQEPFKHPRLSHPKRDNLPLRHIAHPTTPWSPTLTPHRDTGRGSWR